MECNKDAAVECRTTAAARFEAEDFKSARALLQKAERLYPALDGLQQLQAIVKVHEMAQVKFGDHSDWYGILQVEQTADEATIKKQYKKLALGVHPDKNKFPGAEAAFKILSEAHAVLSDQARRWQHDALRQRQNAGTGLFVSRAPFSSAAAPPPPTANQPDVAGAFWTKCPGCSTQYQYYRRYLQFRVTCGKCQTSYVAVEVPRYPTQAYVQHCFNVSKQQRKAKQAQKRNARKSGKEEQAKVDEMLRGAGQAKSQPQGADEQAKPRQGKVKKQEEEVAGETQKVEGVEVDKPEEAMGETQTAEEQRGTPVATPAAEADKQSEATRVTAASASEKQTGFGAAATSASASEQGSSKRTRSRKRPRTVLVDDGDDDNDYVEGQPKVEPVAEQQERPGSQPRRSTRTRGQARYTFKQYDKLDEDDDLVQFPGSKKSGSQQSHATEEENAAPETAAVDSKPSIEELAAISLEDNVFHDFDKGRRSGIARGQIWAAYDDLDGMPRWYCRIYRIGEEEAKINWFESIPRTKHSPGCGEFKQQKTIKSVSLDALSYAVETASDTDNAALVYPKAGQVWCLYENFDSSWLKKQDRGRKIDYSVAEVVRSDFGQGWNVVPLSRLDDFRTVFRRLDDRDWKYVQAAELYKFSHLVPAVKLQGNERADAPPAGCWELDVAALPNQLMQ